MTTEEKRKPDIINYSRRRRIAAGSGTNLAEVNRLIKQFEEMKKMMKQFSNMMGPKGPKGGMKGLKGMLGKGMKFPFG